ncbi:MAG: HAMP domain-containing protein [Candidatus Omnitrophica bacterium]|nr:HAMP domain-containing protein [Candidatus Omnitrophota bacterium]
MMRANSKNIRFRLIAWYLFSLGLVHLVVATALYQMVSAKLYHEFDLRLETYTACLVELLPQHRQLDLTEVVKEMAEVAMLDSHAHIRITDSSNKPIYKSPDTPPDVAASLDAWADTSLTNLTALRIPGSGLWRVIRREVREEGNLTYVGLVAVPLQEVHKVLAHLVFILIVVVPCVLILASVGAWILLNRALSPLKEVIRTAQVIQMKDCSRRLSVPKTGDEVQLLAETFNSMIERLHHSFVQMQRFVSDASHELRTPLAVLRGEVELELKKHPISDRSQETLETCSSEINRMSRLVEMLLFLSNAEAEKVALNLEPIPLKQMIEEMAETARVLAEPKHLRVEVIDGTDAVIRADEMRLKQLFLNLVDNAVKHTPEGGRITLGYRLENGEVELTVADTGVGIETQHLPRIFDRFYRVDSARSRVEGSYGLGLSICKWIAEAHGGTIRVQSRPGEGSTFGVRLPAVTATDEMKQENLPQVSLPLA